MEKSEMRKLAEEICNMSASYDPDNKEWFGHDTGLGDLLSQVEQVLREVEKRTAERIRYISRVGSMMMTND